MYTCPTHQIFTLNVVLVIVTLHRYMKLRKYRSQNLRGAYARLLPISHHFIAFLEIKMHIHSITMVMSRIIAIKNHEKCRIDETLPRFSFCQFYFTVYAMKRDIFLASAVVSTLNCIYVIGQ